MDYTISWDTVLEKWGMNTSHNTDMYNFDSRMKSTVTYSAQQAFPLYILNYQEWLENSWSITLLVSCYSQEASYINALLIGGWEQKLQSSLSAVQCAVGLGV